MAELLRVYSWRVDKMSKNLSKDMTVGSPFKIIVMFAIPVLVGNVFQKISADSAAILA